MVGGERGIALDVIDLVDADAKLFSNDLPDGNPQPLAEIDLAAEHRDRAVAVHGKKESTFLGIDRRGAITASWASAWVRTRAKTKPTVNAPPLRIVRRLKRCGEIDASFQPPCSDAAMTARTTLTWVPQRQRCPSSAERTSSSVGFGFSVNNATALMIIPLVQYPHCATCSLMKAACTGCGADIEPSPSRVVTDLPFACAIVSKHDRVGGRRRARCRRRIGQGHNRISRR